jgi:O-antigen/teichoic acid export membrane protein
MQLSPKIIGVSISISQALAQFLFMIILTRFYGVDSLGRVAYVNSIILIGFMLFSFGLRNVAVVDSEKYSIHQFYSLRILSSVVFLFVFILVVSLLGLDLEVALWLFLYKILEALSEISWATLQGMRKFSQLGGRQLVRFVLPVLALLISAYVGVSMNVSLMIYFLVAAFCFLIFEFRFFWLNGVLKFSTSGVLLMAREYLSMSMSLFFMSIQQNSLRIIVGALLGDVALGVFSIVYQIYSVVYMIFMNAINFSLLKGRTGVKASNGIAFSFFYVFVAVFSWFLFGYDLLSYLFGDVDFGDEFVIGIILFLLIFRLVAYVLQSAMVQGGYFLEVMKVQFFIAVISIFIGYFCVLYYDLIGAYIALVMSGFVYLFVVLFFLKNSKG